jgi:phosphoribosylformimino-5-aminoimidazole carboxamide ribotide isomerase
VNLYPAIDILQGHAVRLVKGDFETKTVYDEEPLAAAAEWVAQGASWLHVIDLDGAKAGRPANLEHLTRIASGTGVPVQFGGGLRSAEAVERALEAGASRVILGTAAFTDPDMLAAALAEHGPERILVSVDTREGRVATHGWLQSTEAPAQEALAALRGQGVRGFVHTDIDHDGMLDGANREQVRGLAAALGRLGEGSLIVSGGVGALEDLRELAQTAAQPGMETIEGVIVGKALYEKRFTVAEALEALA